jgi:predicted enzyme related to lactoylglutathione lyase
MTTTEHNRRIDYIEFAVRSVPDAKRFYGSAFGWSFEDYGPDYASFADGRLSGGFRTEATVLTGGPLVVIYATDLEAMERRVIQAGGTIVRPIFSFPGGRRFHFTDPSGNELAVWSDKGKA